MTAKHEEQGEEADENAPKVNLKKAARISPAEYGLRFAFGFAVSFVAAILGAVGGPRFGGLFLAFPAILPASLTLVEKRRGIAQAASDIRGAAIGAVGMIAFAAVVALTVRHLGYASLPLALFTWIAVSCAIYVLMRLIVRIVGEKQYLPEIPVHEAADVINACRECNLSIGCVESCTGGIIGALLSQVPGASDVFRGSVVAYANETKVGVAEIPRTLIETQGAVSEAVAEAMAVSARRQLGTDIGIGITGVTGKSVEGKAPGVVYIAVSLQGRPIRRQRLRGDEGPGRNEERAVRGAFSLVLQTLGKEKEGR